MKTIQKPTVGEYSPFAAGYVSLMSDDGLVLQHLSDNLKLIKDMVASQPEKKLTHRFAEGEWTIKEILIHIVDTERILAYRALRFARNDTTALAGFEQDGYVASANANERSIAEIFEEYTAVRTATLALFNSFDDAALRRAGLASGHLMTVSAAAFQIAGHELHHINSIKKNYL